MKITPRIFTAILLLFATAFTAVSCSTVRTRIQQRPELFYSLTEQQQQLIRNGQVAVGFSPEMVWLALGQPDRVQRTTGDPRKDEVWQYIAYRNGSVGPLYTGFYHYWYRDPVYPYYLYYPDREAYARYEVTFNEGRVVSYTQTDGA